MALADFAERITSWLSSAAEAVVPTLGGAAQSAGEVAGGLAGQVASGVGAQQWDIAHLAAMAAALGWASGMRLYLVVFLTGAAGYLGWIPLPPGLQLLQNPMVLAASFFMLSVEFLADKVPGIDSLWDSIHTFIRIPAGAALAFGALSGATGADGNTMALVAALAGGTLAATSHAAKATTRAAVNTSPEPFSNIAMSLLGDITVPVVLWLAYEHPMWFWPVLAVLLLIGVALMVLLFKFLRRLLRRFTKPSEDVGPRLIDHV